VQPADQLALLEEEARVAYYKHAGAPYLTGPAGRAQQLWAGCYEARTALAETNQTFAVSLLPSTGALPVVGPGLPVLPTGVRAVVSAGNPSIITLTIDVAGPVSLTVTNPNGGVFSPVVVQTATRASTSFAARNDGLFEVAVLVGNAPLAHLYVPVNRREWARFREDSRYLAFQFKASRPRPKGHYLTRLARLIQANGAAQTGQPALYAQLAASAAAVPESPKPAHVFPYGY